MAGNTRPDVGENTPLLPNNEENEQKASLAKQASSAWTHVNSTTPEADTERKGHIAVGLAIIFIAIGVAYGWLVEGWHFMTSLYVIAQIVTTVGYGDFTVTSELSMMLISFYLMAVMILASYYLNRFAEKLSDAQTARVHERIKKMRSGHGAHSDLSDELVNVLTAGAWFGAFLLFGTIFYANYEACTCSYGSSLVKGCRETSVQICRETGGYTKDYVTSFYMSVVTLLTVGFGDRTPRSYVGRGVGVVWMMVGVACAANFMGSISAYFFATQKNNDYMNAINISEETFKKIDRDGSGTLQRAEFVSFTLQSLGLVPEHVLEEINVLYDHMDECYGGKDDGVAFADIQAIQRQLHKKALEPPASAV